MAQSLQRPRDATSIFPCDSEAPCLICPLSHISLMKKRTLFGGLLAALVMTACDSSGGSSSDSEAIAGGDIAGCATRAYGNIGGPISLINQDGERVTQKDFKGRESLVYFGFTHCPDVCPTALTVAGAALDMLPDDVEKPRTILISVDPERDTPELLASYVESNGFPEDMTGLTGSNADIEAAATSFRTYYKRVDMPDSAAGYTMDHLSILYLMDKDWKLKTFFPGSTTPAQIAECITQLSD